ncbi:hypothetical protein ABWH96_11575 [Marivirga tractuosa]|uniref:hypothetical protein n=1 Tax=Marivirga tractuosa TaxID=1006 RepID=UPI0035CFB54B
MNKSLIFISLLIAGISCSEPEKQNHLSEIYKSLSEQRHFYYNVEYTINKPGVESHNPSIYGFVALNRNSDSGISSAYFGLEENQLPNYLHSIYLKSDWIYDLSSNKFSLNDADLIIDSLHSPILINPELLFEIEADSVKIKQQKVSEEDIKLTFDLKQKPDQLVLMWNDELNKITSLEYRYAVNSENTFSRKWSFEYLAKSEYDKTKSRFKSQNQIAQQPFL